jgi:alcohol dehydrogenase
MTRFENARRLIAQFKGDRYAHGVSVLQRVGPATAALGRNAALVQDNSPGLSGHAGTIRDSLDAAGVKLLGVVPGAPPNAPREDVARIAADLTELAPDVVVSFGGGSTIDATKAAIVLWNLGGDIDRYFGAGLVTQALQATGNRLMPHVAVQTAASSSAHLTKYSNITDVRTGQKKLIVDDAIVPARAVFDYGVTASAPVSLTVDGGLDGISHSLEVLYSLAGKPAYPLIEDVAREGIGLVLEYLPSALRNPSDLVAREGLGLATDLGGYAIMIGGTNGAHLTSFSLVDILTHGRACGLLNPFYTVFFAPAIPGPLRLVAGLVRDASFTDASIDRLEGRALGEAVARALIAFMRSVGSPTSLDEVPGFSDAHLQRALAAAKDPQLRMKLENMPVPLTADMVDNYMGPVLQAARTGDLSLIRTVA